MIKIGAQYYRPPFPESRHWAEDLAAMKEAGLNTLQMWVVWGWVEPAPDQFRFEDYDRLMDLTEEIGLAVVISTIAAIQPTWIHREVPGSEMLTADGRTVVSSKRCEVHYGLTPGGSISHPGVWERMSRFLSTVVERYRSRPNLVGWDAWNELRWNVHAGGLVDYSPVAIAEFRAWLDRKYGGLDGLNLAWNRRYPSWEDVDPGRAPDRPYTEMMAFQHFISWRSDEHARKRYAVIKALDPERPVTVHGARPTVLYGKDHFVSQEPCTALSRGNDWFLADHTDGIGVSSFPAWNRMCDEDYALRMDFLAAAAGGKRKWLSELQGGRSNIGFSLHDPVRAAAQQRWLWEGLSIGADAVLFWCWRDEIFGRESAGFGLAGNDGYREERLAAMRQTGAIVAKHESLLESYRPAEARVGILFSPQAFYLYWAQEGHACRAVDAVCGYAQALLRRQIPYTLVEECHAERLESLDVLFVPRGVVLDEPLAPALCAFVEHGGTLVVESETGAFGANGIYRDPEDRFLARWTGVRDEGRRALPEFDPKANAYVDLTIEYGGRRYTLSATQWCTPLQAMPRCDTSEPSAIAADGMLAVSRCGQGRVITLGSYFGDAYRHIQRAEPERGADFETLLLAIVKDAGVVLPVSVLECVPATQGVVVVRGGTVEGGGSLLFVFAPAGTEQLRLKLAPGHWPSGPARDLLSGKEFQVTEDGSLTLQEVTWGFYALHVNA